MIIDHIDNAAQYAATKPGIAAALDYLAATDLGKLEPGRHELSNGLYAMVMDYETAAADQKQWEAHRKYIDVQFVASGSELMGYNEIGTLVPATDYDESGDAIMLTGKGDFVRLTPGTFAVLFPRDAHMPGVTAGETSTVRKVVVKVPV